MKSVQVEGQKKKKRVVMFQDVKREKPHKLLDNLYLGDRHHAGDTTTLKEIGIIQILNCAKDLKVCEEEFVVKKLDLEDNIEEDITSRLEEAFSFLDNAKGSTLVCCRAGVSRSASISMFYLMYKMKWNLLSVWNHVSR